MQVSELSADLKSRYSGGADSMSYKRHLAAGARCVEIDAWNDEENEEEPKGESLSACD